MIPDTYEEPESPGLVEFKPNYAPKSPTPPPFPKRSQSPASDAKFAGKDPHKAKLLQLHRNGDAAIAALLGSSIAANRPDVARYELDNPLVVDSSPAGRGFYSRELKDTRPLRAQPVDADHINPDLQTHAHLALNLLPSSATEPSKPPRLSDKLPPITTFDQTGPRERRDSRVSLNSRPGLDREPSSSLSNILRTDAENPNSLPAIRDPSIARSPENSGTRLPSIHTQLSQLGPVLPPPNGLTPSNVPSARVGSTSSFPLPPVTAVSPPLTRVDPSPREPFRLAPLVPPAQLQPPKIPPSPYSHLSPASSQAISAASSPVAQPNYWRNVPKAPAPYPPYDPPSTSRSPASSYPTPIEHTPAGTCESSAFTPSSQSSVPQTGTFKCSHPGCTAAPFQTQYLLNSHANVHSQDRPHFCPVEGCSRGYGGKGFKRKNEMIRHGLVHNSPGYVCPFCPDQQHKYPRPDNLQRHVRVHHVDKNKDDPALRNVLSQRPEGSGRGRRARRPNPDLIV
ncbi:hypothetical protein BJY04DRAFT_215304 [Aspergillus karnatakaensis]|uniref:uncharacterized protein n=1 Tax=Aspergillus karnatakaensis TaxID=1810916 RepID=UPI003CCDF1C6